MRTAELPGARTAPVGHVSVCRETAEAVGAASTTLRMHTWRCVSNRGPAPYGQSQRQRGGTAWLPPQ